MKLVKILVASSLAVIMSGSVIGCAVRENVRPAHPVVRERTVVERPVVRERVYVR